MEEQTNMYPNEPVNSPSLKAFSILGIIANSLWILMLLIVIAAGGDFLSKYGGIPSNIMSVMMVIIVIGLILLGLKLWGIIKMMNRKKGGFILYLIPNLIISTIMLLGYVQDFKAVFSTTPTMVVFFTWIGSIVFIFLFSSEMKKIK